jgi:sugar (pentulose or hexulose) kinase
VRRTHVSCGVDLGSTNIKVVAVRADGTVVARYSRPTPRLSNHLSVDAEEMLTLVEEMLLEAAGRDWSIASVCVAGVGEDGVLVDATGHAVVESGRGSIPGAHRSSPSCRMAYAHPPPNRSRGSS